MITGYKSLLGKTFLMRVINQLYIRNVKEILTEPARRFPHTSVSSINTCHLQQGRTNPEYSIVLCKTYSSGGKKDSNDMQGYLACGFIAFAGSITKMCILIFSFISSHL
jgi:hypothetical protein